MTDPYQPQQPYDPNMAQPPYSDPYAAPQPGSPGPSYGSQPPGSPGPSYGSQPGFTADPYSQPYSGQSYTGQEYGGQPYGGQYSMPQYGAQGYDAPQYDAGGYTPQYPTGGYPPQSGGTNVMAILSLVFAFVFAPVAIVLGHIAKKQIQERGEQGDGLATAGLILGYIFTGLTFLSCCLGIVVLVSDGSSTTY